MLYICITKETMKRQIKTLKTKWDNLIFCCISCIVLPRMYNQ